MKASIATALLAAALMLGISAQAASAAAETAAKKAQAAGASDVSARRYHRHERYVSRPNTPYPMYYGRPVYYAPAPFLPIPPLWGYGWEWW
jgi:Ni/Co efflux regulator RcnB